MTERTLVFQREELEVKIEPIQEAEPTPPPPPSAAAPPAPAAPGLAPAAPRRREDLPPNLAEFQRMVAENEISAAAAAAVAADSRE